MANPKKIARKILPKKVLRAVENEYRLARASYANARFNWPAKGMRVIMITGTNGKTTTAHYLFSILRSAGYSVGMLSTAEFRVNDKSQINDTNMTAIEPVPLRRHLAEFKAVGVDFVILEATSQALDQQRLFGIPCEVAVMTNLTQDHLDYHQTMEQYASAKAKLWQLRPKLSVLNSDDEWYPYFLRAARTAGSEVVTYGKDADISVAGYKPKGTAATFTLSLPDGKSVIENKLIGMYNTYNATCAAAVASSLGVKGEAIEKGIEDLTHVPGRLEPVATNKPFSVVVDYAHTPDGLEKVLQAGKELVGKSGKIWLVFGACGDRDRAKRPLMGKIAAQLADRVILTDEESYSEDPQHIRSEIQQGIAAVKRPKGTVTEIADRKKAIKHALDNAKKGDLVLITGLGHEKYRIIAGQRVPWNDTDVVKKFLK